MKNQILTSRIETALQYLDCLPGTAREESPLFKTIDREIERGEFPCNAAVRIIREEISAAEARLEQKLETLRQQFTVETTLRAEFGEIINMCIDQSKCAIFSDNSANIIYRRNVAMARTAQATAVQRKEASA